MKMQVCGLKLFAGNRNDCATFWSPSQARMKISHLLRSLLLPLLLCCAAPHSRAADDSDTLADFKGTKIVVLHDTVSPDGRYALGWTLQPASKKQKPVDWSLWAPSEKGKFLDHYHLFDAGESRDYEVDYFAVDLKGKTTVPIPEDFYSVHGGIYVAWSGDAGGRRYAILQFDYKWGTGIWLLTIDPQGMRLASFAKDMDKVVEGMLPPKKTRSSEDNMYVTYYSIVDEDSLKPLQIFHGPTAGITFESYAPHNEDLPTANGIITLRLEDGKVLGAAPPDPAADALQRNPGLKKADDELNNVYHSLMKTLDTPARAALRKEQREWIASRDAAIEQAKARAIGANAALQESRTGARTEQIAAATARLASAQAALDKAQLDATRKRTAELKARLFKATYHNPEPNEGHSSTGKFLLSNERTVFEPPGKEGRFSITLREQPEKEYAIYTYPRFADIYFSPKDSYAVVDDHDGSGSNRCALLKSTPHPPYFIPATPEYVDDACWKLFWAKHPVKGKIDYAHRRTYFCQWLDDTHFVAGLQGESINGKGLQDWSLSGGWHCLIDAATGEAATSEFTESLNKDTDFSTN